MAPVDVKGLMFQTETDLSGGVLAQRFLITVFWQLDLTQYPVALAWRRHQQ